MQTFSQDLEDNDKFIEIKQNQQKEYHKFEEEWTNMNNKKDKDLFQIIGPYFTYLTYIFLFMFYFYVRKKKVLILFSDYSVLSKNQI